MAMKKTGKKRKSAKRAQKVRVKMDDLIEGLGVTIKMQSAILKVLEGMPARMKKRLLPAQTRWFAGSREPGIAVGEHCECEAKSD